MGGLLATTTHDTKRSGDVRAHLAAVTADPAGWEELVRPRLAGALDPNEAYLTLQTVVGAWPLTPERLDLYLEKAFREAKLRTSWLEPDREWEERAKTLGRSLLADEGIAAYVENLRKRAKAIVLGATLLELTSPGVPDLYQGDELPYFALVDPDNRRPVDWEARRRALASGDRPKLELIRRALALRARRPAAFAGAYEPLHAGPDVCAFTRGGEVLVAVAVRGGLRGFRPPAHEWRDVFRTDSLLLAERG